MEQLKAMYPVCTLIKPDGTRCGSPALTGMNFCFQHIGGKVPSTRAKAQTRTTNAPLKFLYPGSHEAIQHNLFLVVQALSEGKIDNATAIAYNSLFRSAQLNLHRWQKSKLTHGEVEQQMTPCAEPATNAGAPHLAVFEMWDGAKREKLDPESNDQRSGLNDPSVLSVSPVVKIENEGSYDLNAERRSLNPVFAGCHPERTGVPTDRSSSVGWGSATIGKRAVEGPALNESATDAAESHEPKPVRLHPIPYTLSPAVKPYLTWAKNTTSTSPK